jgi:hypothetical protein
MVARAALKSIAVVIVSVITEGTKSLSVDPVSGKRSIARAGRTGAVPEVIGTS